MGVVAERIEHILGSDPAKLRIMSVNPDYETYERDAEEVNVMGRVVWSARRHLRGGTRRPLCWRITSPCTAGSSESSPSSREGRPRSRWPFLHFATRAQPCGWSAQDSAAGSVKTAQPSAMLRRTSGV